MAKMGPEEVKAKIEAVRPKLTAQHAAMLDELTPEDQVSMAKNVTPENIDIIQEWIGTDEEIERMLFWYKAGKFDDPEWHKLEPADEASRALYDKARVHFEELRKQAVRSQRRADLALHSQFNFGLLYTGFAPAVRCNPDGSANAQGTHFCGVEWRLVGSVEDIAHSITMFPLSDSDFEVHFGARVDDAAQGVPIYTGDSYTVTQVDYFMKTLSRLGYELVLKDTSGNVITLPESREIRRRAMKGEDLGVPPEVVLCASKRADSAQAAIETSDELATYYYQRFGLEVECWNIGKKYGNFYILRDDNFEQTFENAAKKKGLVLLTATLVCRRCRREMEGFRDMARDNPEMDFALVNLNSPLFKFYDRVFGDMSGGKGADEFRKTAAGVTPYIILYKTSDNGQLEFVTYYGTGKADETPTHLDGQAMMDYYIYKKPGFELPEHLKEFHRKLQEKYLSKS